MSILQTNFDVPVEHQKNVFGQFDANIKQIEKELHVTILNRDGAVRLIGPDTVIDRAKRVLETLMSLSKNGNVITEQDVTYALTMAAAHQEQEMLTMDQDVICRTVSGKPIKPKTLGQKQYIDAIRKNMLVFGIGPAGTGKTYLAMAMAIQAFRESTVNRIILTRPAIEAGEKLGFLPGDLQSKIDPYLRPLYDALYQIMGPEGYLHNTEKGLIEVAPLAYMRGRTLDNAFIILDEAQNTTPAQMKMFLTRIGFGSKVIVTGDMSQKDLPSGQASGLDVVRKVLPNVEGIHFSYLTNQDVVRHPLVQRIVKAYETYEEKELQKKDQHRGGAIRVRERGHQTND